MKDNRPDRNGTHRGQYELNKKRIYATQRICGICGKPVDMELKYPNPLSKCIDHIIPVKLNGHPSDIDNLQLAHLVCNLKKADKMTEQAGRVVPQQDVITNRNLPQTVDWTSYKS